MRRQYSVLPLPVAYLHFITISPLIKIKAIKNQQDISTMIYDEGKCCTEGLGRGVLQGGAN